MEEQGTECKICRGPSEPDAPLYSPCKCKGSIGAVHESCLFDWLGVHSSSSSMSRKGSERCEVCGTPFRFQKVYRAAPASMPWSLVLRQAGRTALWLTSQIARFCLVALCWLALLPYCIVWTFRFFIYTSNSFAFVLSGLKPEESHAGSNATTSALNATREAVANITESLSSSQVPVGSLEETDTAASLWHWDGLKAVATTIGKDCFTGQIIMCSSVIVFIAFFLLREWIQQQQPLEAAEALAEEQDNAQQQRDAEERPPELRQNLDELDVLVRGLIQRNNERRELQQARQQQQQELEAGGDDHVGDHQGEGAPQIQYTNAPFADADDPVASSELQDRIRLEEELQNGQHQHPQDQQNDAPGPTYSTWQPPEVLQHSERTPDSSEADEQPEEMDDLPADSEMGHDTSDTDPSHIFQDAAEHMDAEQEDAEPGDDDPEDDNWMDVFDPEEDVQGADDADGGIDDFDGILEAVGLRGNIVILLQTVALMHLFVTLFLAATIWLPIFLGKSLVASDAFHYLFAGPVKLVRFLTDPIVDLGTGLTNKAFALLALPLQPVLSRLPSLSTLAQRASAASSGGGPAVPSLFEPSKQYVSQAWCSLHAIWASMSQNDSAWDRFFCIVLGYAVGMTAVALWWYRDMQLERPWSRKLQKHIEHYGLLLKVAMFVVVELLAFPAVCGICLDLMTLPLWKDTSMASRWAFMLRAPYSGVFLHWAAGTLFMFVVAQWISLCRGTLRKGALFFVRDPRDPDANPIKEMIDQSISTQFGKLGKSIILYACLMAAFLTAALAVHLVYPGFIPIRWHASDPLLSVPLDFLFVVFALPPSVKALKPVRTVRVLFHKVAAFVARPMRLTSFFFGTPAEDETGSYVYTSWKAALQDWLPFTSPTAAEGDIKVWKATGSLSRVPATDHIKILPGRPSTIAVHPNGEAVSQEGADHIAAQKEAGLTDEDFKLLFVPPQFRFRLMFSLYMVWVIGATCGMASATLPLLVGRILGTSLLGRELHDGYAFLLGAYSMYPLIWALSRQLRLSQVKSRRRKTKSQSRRDSISSRSSEEGASKLKWPSKHSLRSCASTLGHRASELTERLRARSALVMTLAKVVVLGMVALPLTTGMHTHLVFSVFLTARNELPLLWLPMLWCYGIAEITLAYAVTRNILPHNPTLSHLFDDFAIWPEDLSLEQYLDRVLSRLILPQLRGNLKNITFPSAAVLISTILEVRLRDLGVASDLQNAIPRKVAFKLAFPAFELWAVRGSLRNCFNKMAKSWLDSLKDEEFLLARHVLNYKSQPNSPTQDEVVVLPPLGL